MRTGMKQVTLGVAVSLTAAFLAAGCGKKTEKVRIIVDTPTPTVAQGSVGVTASLTPGLSVSARPSDGDSQIDLPKEQAVPAPIAAPAQEPQVAEITEVAQQTTAEVERTGSPSPYMMPVRMPRYRYRGWVIRRKAQDSGVMRMAVFIPPVSECI